MGPHYAERCHVWEKLKYDLSVGCTPDLSVQISDGMSTRWIYIYIYIYYIYKTSGAHNESANIEIRETDFRSISNLAEYDHRFIIER